MEQLAIFWGTRSRGDPFVIIHAIEKLPISLYSHLMKSLAAIVTTTSCERGILHYPSSICPSVQLEYLRSSPSYPHIICPESKPQGALSFMHTVFSLIEAPGLRHWVGGLLFFPKMHWIYNINMIKRQKSVAFAESLHIRCSNTYTAHYAFIMNI